VCCERHIGSDFMSIYMHSHCHTAGLKIEDIPRPVANCLHSVATHSDSTVPARTLCTSPCGSMRYLVHQLRGPRQRGVAAALLLSMQQATAAAPRLHPRGWVPPGCSSWL
jgi:hypothetical protein